MFMIGKKNIFCGKSIRKKRTIQIFLFAIVRNSFHSLQKFTANAQKLLLINYKQWRDDTHTSFKITQIFASPWVQTSSLQLNIEGQSLPRIYDNFGLTSKFLCLIFNNND
jgi:hypothetical protein